ALVDLYEATGGSSWDNNSGWLQGNPSDSWYGVEVDADGRVVRLDLADNNLRGSEGLPASIGNLTRLRYLNVMYNRISGPLPEVLFTRLRRLVYLYLNFSTSAMPKSPDLHEQTQTGGGDIHTGKTDQGAGNKFTGQIPSTFDLPELQWFALSWTEITKVAPEVFTSSKLRGLWLANNPGLGGNRQTIPSYIGQLTDLEQLALNSSPDQPAWGGQLPAEFANLTSLKSLRLSRNPFTGRFPDLSGATGMQTFLIDHTDFTSGFPAYGLDGGWPEINAFLASFTEFSDAYLPGDAPHSLRTLNLPDTGLDGSLPEGAFPRQMIVTDFSWNSLSGATPRDLRHLVRIRNLRWSDNDLEGPWPELDWTNQQQLTNSAGTVVHPLRNFSRAHFNGNRYVFADMLVVSDDGKTLFEWYQQEAEASFRYGNQKPFGSTADKSGSRIDFSGEVTHPDNEYRWYRNGSQLSGASGNVLDAAAYGTGTYRLEVTNPNVPGLTLQSVEIQVTQSDLDGSGDTTNPPSAPTLSSPADGATGISTNPTLDWNSVSGADSYRLQLSSNPDFTNLTTDQTGISGTQYQVSNLANNDTYYWRVQAVNSAGSSNWSAVRDFTTVESGSSTTLSAPAPGSPNDGATGISTSPTLSWSSVDGADNYRLQLSAQSDFSSVVTDTLNLTTAEYQASGLNNSTTYYWRVLATSATDTSNWSEVYDFTTHSSSDTSTLAAPTLVSPSDDAVNTGLEPTFEWQPVNGADYYILHTNRINPGEMVIEAEVNGTSFTPSGPLNPETTFDWRVRAVKDGQAGEWSVIWRFTTGSGYDFPLTITGTEGMRMVSSPAANTTLADLLGPLWNQGVEGSDAEQQDPNIFVWNEEQQSFDVPSSMSDVMAPGEGYITWVFEDDDPLTGGVQGGFPKELGVDGTENNSPVDVPVSVTDANNSGGIDGQEGWNLVGNPYGTTILVDEILAAAKEVNPQVNANVYVWDPALLDYVSLPEGEGHVIEPFQVFWLRYLSEDTGTLTLDKTLLSAANKRAKYASQRNNDENDKEQEVTFILEQDSSLSDEFTVAFSEGASVGEDLMDAYDLSSLNPMSDLNRSRSLNIYSIFAENERETFARNVLPAKFTDEIEVQIGISSGSSSDITISWSELRVLPSGWTLELNDRRTGKTIDLRTTDSYSYRTASGVDNARFLLKVSPNGSIENPGYVEKPGAIRLSQNYPNPFNPTTEISYTLNRQAEVNLTIYNLLGKKIATLVNNRVQGEGSYTVRFNGVSLTSGIYIYRLSVGNKVMTKKMTLVK
ncbi:MAG: T9SS type A sorting domain-containing protein, partial [Balneolaceae bacterium]|nr:T9SS type A sorting domain-containing protein [Balneolaceae bacterium]